MNVQDQQQTQREGNDGFLRSKANPNHSYSPGRNEILHMKPSNAFEDITEDEFNAREERKHTYQRELMKQM